jgi:predicted ferric reductase
MTTRKLYKDNQRSTQSKLYEYFIKLLDQYTTDIDNNIKWGHKLTVKKLSSN